MNKEEIVCRGLNLGRKVKLQEGVRVPRLYVGVPVQSVFSGCKRVRLSRFCKHVCETKCVMLHSAVHAKIQQRVRVGVIICLFNSHFPQTAIQTNDKKHIVSFSNAKYQS